MGQIAAFCEEARVARYKKGIGGKALVAESDGAVSFAAVVRCCSGKPNQTLAGVEGGDIGFIGIVAGSKMCDLTGESQFERGQDARLAHAIGAVNQHDLRVEWHGNLTPQASEVFENKALEPNIVHCRSPSSSRTALTELPMSSAKTVSTACLPRGAAAMNASISVPAAAKGAALRKSASQSSIVSTAGG